MYPYADIYGLEQFSKPSWTVSQNIGKSGILREFVPLLKKVDICGVVGI